MNALALYQGTTSEAAEEVLFREQRSGLQPVKNEDVTGAKA